MLEIRVCPVQLHLINPFTLAHGTSLVRENVFIEMKIDGYTVYGEAPIVPYYFVSKEAVIGDITSTLKNYSRSQILDFVDSGTSPSFTHATSLAAFQTATLNLRSALSTKSAEELLSIKTRYNPPKSTFTIAYHEDIDKMVDIATSCGFSHLKIKAGIPGDIIRIKAIRAALPHAKIFVDANQGWSVDEANTSFKELAHDNITLIEEPIKGSPKEIEELARSTSIPLYLDESIQNEKDLHLFFQEAPHLAGIVVKSAKVGGPYNVKEMIQTAQQNSMQVFLSSMIESSIGILSVVPFTHLCPYVDLDGPLLISNAPFTGLRYERERLCYDENGSEASDEVKGLFDHSHPITLLGG
ncbi:MAG: hypothetical protein JEY71_00690 [Sphaerochaeta sp.]|nr:hypothetical protein [Sphaerochaeta sp.]